MLIYSNLVVHIQPSNEHLKIPVKLLFSNIKLLIQLLNALIGLFPSLGPFQVISGTYVRNAGLFYLCV